MLNKPIFFKPKRAPSGAWTVELYDLQLKAMGLASRDRAPLVFESILQAESYARKRGLRALQEHKQ